MGAATEGRTAGRSTGVGGVGGKGHADVTKNLAQVVPLDVIEEHAAEMELHPAVQGCRSRLAHEPATYELDAEGVFFRQPFELLDAQQMVGRCPHRFLHPLGRRSLDFRMAASR